MKRMSLIFSLLIVLCSCTKNNQVNDIKDNLAGTWELERFISWSPLPLPQPQPGNGNLLVFTRAGIVERKKGDTLLFRGVYRLERKEDCYPRRNDTRLITEDNELGSEYYLSIIDGKLHIDTPNCWADGGGTIYSRIR